MYRIPDHEVAFVKFVRPLNPYTVGSTIDGDEFRSWPEANRRAIVEQGYVELVAKQPAEGVAALNKGELVRVVVPRDDGRFDVVEGRKINAEPMADEDATKLADELPSGPPQKAEDALENEPGIPQPEKKTRSGGRPKGSKNKAKRQTKPKPKSKPRTFAEIAV